MKSEKSLIRATKPKDADAIIEITRNQGVFSADEILTVRELLDEYFTKGAKASGYYFLSCCYNNQVAGFACYGERPLTHGTFDLYWIAVDKNTGRRGTGKKLVKRIMMEIKKMGARLLVAETSGKPEYAPARHFYLRTQFEQAAVIADFYAPADDMVIYVRRVKDAGIKPSL